MTDDGRGLVEAGRWLSERGLAPGASGNLSLRTPDGALVTPTGTPLGRLTEAGLSRLDASGAHVAGDRPTKEAALHRAVYAVRPDCHAVVHLHSTHAVALSCLGDLDPDAPLLPLTPYQVMRVDPVGLVPYHRPGSAELAAAVQALAARHRVMLLLNHGSLVAAESLDAAVFAAEELEEVARIRFLVEGRSVRPLTPDEVEEVRRTLLG